MNFPPRPPAVFGNPEGIPLFRVKYVHKVSGIAGEHAILMTKERAEKYAEEMNRETFKDIEVVPAS